MFERRFRLVLAGAVMMLTACGEQQGVWLDELHAAASTGDPAHVQHWLNTGADPNGIQHGWTPLELTLQSDRPGTRQTIVRWLLDKGADPTTVLYRAVTSGNKDNVSLLLSAGVDPDTGRNGVTSLHLAATTRGRADVARLLLGAGADTDVKDRSGNTPLHRAASFGHEDVARLLLGAGADPNAENRNGETPLNLAVARGRTDVARLLRAAGAVD